ncbi:MAG TPA: hypothetical protein VNL91_11265 [Thermoanaerobaculia bacterium]|nr:hypothetical protein [Thermoanaerobaculia bacterium]
MTSAKRRIEFALALAFVIAVSTVMTISFDATLRAYDEESRLWERRAVAYGRLMAAEGNDLAIRLRAARREAGLHPVAGIIEEAEAAHREGRTADLRASLIAMEQSARSMQTAIAEASHEAVVRFATHTAGALAALLLLGAAAVASYFLRPWVCSDHASHPDARTLEIEIWEPRPVGVKYVHASES